MHYTYDPQADALYIYLQEDGRVTKTIRVDDARNVDLDGQGNVVGVEILSPGRTFVFEDLIEQFRLADFRQFLESVATTTFQPVMPTAP